MDILKISVLDLSGGVGAMATMARPAVDRMRDTELHVDLGVLPSQFDNICTGGWLN